MLVLIDKNRRAVAILDDPDRHVSTFQKFGVTL